MAAFLTFAGISSLPVAALGADDDRQRVALTDLGAVGAQASVAVDVNSYGKLVGNAFEPATGASQPVGWLAAKAPYSPIAEPFAPAGRALQVNDRNQTAGALDEGGSTHAVLWQGPADEQIVIRPDALFSAAVDLNDRGDVLLWYATEAPEGAEHHAAIWNQGHETLVLPVPGAAGPHIRPVALNSRGEVVLTEENASGAPAAAYHWFDGQLTDIGSLGGGGTAAVAIDEHGWIAGTSLTGAGEERAFLWQDGTMRDLGTLGGGSSRATPNQRALSDAGHVIGTSLTAAGEERAFLWQDGTMRDLGTLGGGNAEPVAVTDAGQVVGNSLTGDGQQHAFFWDGDELLDLGTLGGSISRAHALNEAGLLAGVSLTETGEHHAVVWEVKRP